MKTFTFIIFLMVTSIGLNAQDNYEIRLKLQKLQKQYAEISYRFNVAAKVVNKVNSAAELKSDVISQKLDSTVNQVYNELGSVWQKDYKDEFLYDEQMRNTDWIDSEWNLATSIWDAEFKAKISYGSNGLVSSMLWYDTDSLTNMFVESARYDYFYNLNGMPDSALTYFTTDAGVNWDLMAVQNNYYNASKQLIKTENRAFDFDEGEMVQGMTTNYTYTALGKIKNSTSSFIIEGSEFQTNKSEYSYDASNRLSFIEYYDLNYFTFQLEKSDRDLFQYNANNDVSFQIYSTWTGALWMDEYKDEYEYGTMNLSQVAFPVFFALWSEEDGQDELRFSKAINLINSYEMVDGAWTHTDINTFYYSASSSTGINEFVNADFKIYPNPAKDVITFNWRGNNDQLALEMYQITGAKVLEQNVREGKEISVSHLVNGIYFFKLMFGQQIVYSGKLVKR